MGTARYHGLAIALHWVMALAFFGMLGSGLTMANVDMDKGRLFALYQWHKSLGVLLLMAFFLRLAVRIWHKPPALPLSMGAWERKAAHAGHWALYGWMLALPLSGWLVVSSSPYGIPTIVFGWFEWPHIPFAVGNSAINEIAEEAHELLAFSFMVLIAGHIIAVVKHAVMEKENLLPRMGIGRVKKGE
ncbi:MAG: cytochrome b [Rickettsiales bacterium]|nr:cytochrome b [Rickettsiales bacterium]